MRISDQRKMKTYNLRERSNTDLYDLLAKYCEKISEDEFEKAKAQNYRVLYLNLDDQICADTEIFADCENYYISIMKDEFFKLRDYFDTTKQEKHLNIYEVIVLVVKLSLSVEI
jgi:hypothetical protein